jgi:hypothetical protein
VKIGLADKVRFEIAVSEPFVQPAIDALCEGARTGEVGDGKIFVVPLERVVRIRTGETDDSAVTPFISPIWAMVLGALAALPSYAVMVLRPRSTCSPPTGSRV